MEQTILPKTMHDKVEFDRANSKSFVLQQSNVCQNSAIEKSANRTMSLEKASKDSVISNEAKLNILQQKIIQAILSGADAQRLTPQPQDILLNAAREIGIFCQVEACAVISSSSNLVNHRQIGWWSNGLFSADEQNRLQPQLSNLFSQGNAVEGFGTKAATKSYFLAKSENLVREHLPNKALLAIPIHYQNQVNGAILLVHTKSYRWTNSEQELLENISETMAIAISQVQLQQQNQTKTRYQNLLNHLSREISQNSDPDVLLGTCLAEIGKALKVDRGMILMLKYKDPLRTKRNLQQLVKGKVKIVHQWHQGQNNLQTKDESTFNLKDSPLCQQAWQLAPESLAISELATFPDLAPEQLADGIESKSSALLMMPLMGKKISESQPALVLGFLVLQNDTPRLWLQDELDLINWISVQISTAIIHHQTLSQIQSLVDERTAKLKWSLDVHAKLSEKMRQQIDQLQKLNELKDDFMSSMSHELKTPLTSMKMAIKMLRQAGIPPAMREKYLNILEQEWNREYNLIKDLLTLQQVESGELSLSPQELNLDRIVEELATSFNDKWQLNKGLTLKTKLSDSALNLYTDSESLEHILSELLLNAGKYSDVDTTIELSANSTKTFKHNEIAIAISNYGAGIAPEELPHIFDKFRRGKGVTDRAVPGTGLGLALVKYLVDHLNGTIDVTSKPVDNSEVFKTTFTVKLPQFQPGLS